MAVIRFFNGRHRRRRLYNIGSGFLGVVSSEVERFLDTEEVRSSILLPPTSYNAGGRWLIP